MQSDKTLWCSYYYTESMVKNMGYNPFRENRINGCKYGKECRGAHSENEIKISSEINRFNSFNKTKFDWVKLYLNILITLKNDIPRIKGDTYKVTIQLLDKINFFEVLDLWKKLASEFRKIYKNDELVEQYGYDFKEDVPTFNLADNYEDITWSLERLTHICPIYSKFKNNLDNKIKISIRDVCIAPSMNCKNGCHTNSEIICKDDFLKGSCNCKSLEEFMIHTSNLIAKMESIDPKTDKYKKFQNKLIELGNSRPIHYTDGGMMPFEEQYNKYLENIKEKIQAEKMEQLKLEEDVKKQSDNIKPVIKLKKLGKT